MPDEGNAPKLLDEAREAVQGASSPSFS